MRATILLLLIGFGAAAADGQSNHPPQYLYGGHWYPTQSPGRQMGVLIADLSGAQPSIQRVFPRRQWVGSFDMDADNRHVVISLGINDYSVDGGPYAGGIVRVDPASGVLTTILGCGVYTSLFLEFYNGLSVNQDGDYVVMRQRSVGAWPQKVKHHLLKVDRSGSRVTTIVDIATWSQWAGAYFGFDGHKIGVDIDSGNYLCGLREYPPFVPIRRTEYVFEVTPQGVSTSWSSPFAYYLPSLVSMGQNHLNGHLEGPVILPAPHPANSTLSIQRLARGGGVTTLRRYQGTMTPCVTNTDAFEWDLQTAASPRIVGTGWHGLGAGDSQFVFTIDSLTGKYTETRVVSGLAHPGRDFAFYRGRHTQTELVSPRKWRIRFSAPQHPGKAYVAALGMSGVRPGLRLPDGRRLNLYFDRLTRLTLLGGLPGLWDPGPGRLDSGGEAQGQIDFTWFPQLGRPIWIVWAVLDPQAPLGIAYLPDTYVMRI